MLDEGNWDGPFYIMDPFGNRTKIYGKIGKYEKAQKDFCEKYDKVLNEYQLQKKEAEKRKYSRRTIQKAIHNSLASRIESHFIKKDTSQEEE